VFLAPIPAHAWSSDAELNSVVTGWIGFETDDQLGYVATCGGDMNGDGVWDIAIAAPGHDSLSEDTGVLWLFDGPTALGDLHLDDSAATTAIHGEVTGQSAGWACSCAGDLDADGYQDVVLTSPFHSNGVDQTGAAFLVFGRANGWPGSVELAGVDVSFLGEYDEDEAGYSVETEGDYDGDGAQDLIVGAPFNDSNGWHSGKVYVYYGRPQSQFVSDSLANADAAFIGHASDKSAGGAVARAGDPNGDGLDDLLIGNANEGGSWENWTYLVFGNTNRWASQTDLALADASFVGEALGDDAGNTVAAAGDTNGDGLDDFLVGAPYNNESGGVSGQVYLVFGRTSGWSTGFSLAYADASFLGEGGGDVLGWSLSGAGDVNGDGLDDFMIGAPGNGEYQADAGQAYLFFGKTTGWAMDVTAGDADASFIGEAVDDQAGWSVAGGGDLDGDGFADLLIGAPFCDDGASDAGQVYVIYGTSCEDQDGDGFGDPADPNCPGGSDLDCDDLDAAVHPGATETCDGTDEDCDGVVPLNEADDDHDGFRICEDDCDDTNAAVYPGAAESCDNVDNDCDGSQPVWDQDLDGDGTSSCAGDCDDSDAAVHTNDLDADGYSPCDGDCDDADPTRSPGVAELCDGLDNNCDNTLPNDEADADGDGLMGCEGDCDDNDSSAYPGAEELCDERDNDCNGIADDLDADGDGYTSAECGGTDCDDSDPSVNPDTTELCDDLVDNDCDGLADSEDDDCAAGDDDTSPDDGDDDTSSDDVTTTQPKENGGCACALGPTCIARARLNTWLTVLGMLVFIRRCSQR